MKALKWILAVGFAISFSAMCPAATNAPVAKSTYDAELAKQLGGNDNGMRQYVLVILKTGPNDANIKDKARDALFSGHMENIGRLAELGKLAVAGPFGKNDRAYRGIFILAVSTVAEAQALVETDPAVKAGIFIAEMTLWYGSASLMATPEIHKTITKPQ